MNFSQEHNKKQFLQPSVNAISAMLELPVSIWLVDESKEALRAVAFTESLEKIIGVIPLRASNVAVGVFRMSKTAIIEDIEADENWQLKAETLSMGLKSAIISPLRVKNRDVGVLTLYVPENKSEDLEALRPKAEASASQIAATLESFEKECDKAQALARLSEISHELLSIQTLPDARNLLKKIADSAKEVLKADLIELYELTFPEYS